MGNINELIKQAEKALPFIDRQIDGLGLKKVIYYKRDINKNISQTVCLLIRQDNVVFRGVSKRNNLDPSSRTVGRFYAMRRALRAFDYPIGYLENFKPGEHTGDEYVPKCESLPAHRLNEFEKKLIG